MEPAGFDRTKSFDQVVEHDYPVEFDRVVVRYKSTVYGIALTRTRSRDDADDVFQDVFLAYFRRGISFNDEEHRKAWLIRAAINCSKKCLSKRPRDTVELTGELAETLAAFPSDEDGAVYAALCELPETYRTALHLFYLEDLPVAEIARALRLRPGTARMRLARGRALLREKLKGEFPWINNGKE